VTSSGLVVVAFRHRHFLREKSVRNRKLILHQRNVMKRTSLIPSRGIAALALVLSTAAGRCANKNYTNPDNTYSPGAGHRAGAAGGGPKPGSSLPVLRDDAVSSYPRRYRAAASSPQSHRILQHPEFRYTFEPVNVREIKRVSRLPGRTDVRQPRDDRGGRKQRARLRGVMAHELSHVVLPSRDPRRPSKATKYEIGQVAGAVLGRESSAAAGAR